MHFHYKRTLLYPSPICQRSLSWLQFARAEALFTWMISLEFRSVLFLYMRCVLVPKYLTSSFLLTSLSDLPFVWKAKCSILCRIDRIKAFTLRLFAKVLIFTCTRSLAHVYWLHVDDIMLVVHFVMTHQSVLLNVYMPKRLIFHIRPLHYRTKYLFFT